MRKTVVGTLGLTLAPRGGNMGQAPPQPSARLGARGKNMRVHGALKQANPGQVIAHHTSSKQGRSPACCCKCRDKGICVDQAENTKDSPRSLHDLKLHHSRRRQCWRHHPSGSSPQGCLTGSWDVYMVPARLSPSTHVLDLPLAAHNQTSQLAWCLQRNLRKQH